MSQMKRKACYCDCYNMSDWEKRLESGSNISDTLPKEKIYSCGKCKRNFSPEHNALVHKLSYTKDDSQQVSSESINHVTNQLYSCDLCDKKFSRRHDLTCHIRLHTKPHLCSQCGRSFATKSRLNSHAYRHKERPYSCNLCNKSFFRSIDLVSHAEFHSEVRRVCDICNKSFKSKDGLEYHKRCHAGDRPYSCDLCDKNFISKQALKEHMTVHCSIKCYTCNVCSRQFLEKKNLHQHYRTHVKEEPKSMLRDAELYSDSVCDESASVSHSEIYTEEKPYPCDMCNGRFSSKSRLISHKNFHIKLGNSYICSTCNKTFLRQCALDTHLRYCI